MQCLAQLQIVSFATKVFGQNWRSSLLSERFFLTKLTFVTFVRNLKNMKFQKFQWINPEKSMNKKVICGFDAAMCWEIPWYWGDNYLVLHRYVLCFSGVRSDCDRKKSCLPAFRRRKALPENRLKSRCHDDAQLHNLACLCYMVTRKLYSQYTCSCNCAAEGRYDRHKRRLYCMGWFACMLDVCIVCV